jgi:hypothetical protein
MKLELPDIPEAEQTPVIKGLLVYIELLIEHSQKQQEDIEVMKDEIRILKGEKKRPKFKPSKLDESTNDKSGENASEEPSEGDNTGQSDNEKKPKKPKKKRSNKRNLPVDREARIKPDNIPEGSRYHSHKDFYVQELVIKSEHIRYRLERWMTPDGKLLIGKLPESLENRHYGSTLVTYLLYQHNHCQTTQPLLTYMRQHKLKKVPRKLLDALAASPVFEFADKKALDEQLELLGITDERHIRIATEGALIGALLYKGDVEKLAIISDGAGQFAVLVSGGTRSDVGQQCRDTFASLKKTCRKLGVSFWQYLIERSHDNLIPPLPVMLSKKLSRTTPIL